MGVLSRMEGMFETGWYGCMGWNGRSLLWGGVRGRCLNLASSRWFQTGLRNRVDLRLTSILLHKNKVVRHTPQKPQQSPRTFCELFSKIPAIRSAIENDCERTHVLMRRSDRIPNVNRRVAKNCFLYASL